MARFGGELLFFVGLGYVLLGPQRMHKLLQQIARAKREFDSARQQIDNQLSRTMEMETKGRSSDVI